MRRPTRTRRLSIAAIVSLLLFVAVAGAGVRSFWTWDEWSLGTGLGVDLIRGCIDFMHQSKGNTVDSPLFAHSSVSADATDTLDSLILPKWSFAGFSERHVGDGNSTFEQTYFAVPLWPLLLLLLIVPVRWLFARAPNTPAFAVVTDVKRS